MEKWCYSYNLSCSDVDDIRNEEGFKGTTIECDMNCDECGYCNNEDYTGIDEENSSTKCGYQMSCDRNILCENCDYYGQYN